MGPPNARATIVVFADFQCPYCAVLTVQLRKLRLSNPDNIAIVYRHFPIADHPSALAAATAAECAAAQGRFAEFHDTLFSRQHSIGTTSWSRFASISGVPDSSAFSACMSTPDTMPAILRDISAGRSLGAQGTPTFLVNDLRFDGVPPFDTLQAYVQAAATRQR